MLGCDWWRIHVTLAGENGGVKPHGLSAGYPFCFMCLASQVPVNFMFADSSYAPYYLTRVISYILIDFAASRKSPISC